MNSVTTVTAILALLGSGIVGGVFYAFSSFVMKALARVPSEEGIAAMQSTNVVVISPVRRSPNDRHHHAQLDRYPCPRQNTDLVYQLFSAGKKEGLFLFGLA